MGWTKSKQWRTIVLGMYHLQTFVWELYVDIHTPTRCLFFKHNVGFHQRIWSAEEARCVTGALSIVGTWKTHMCHFSKQLFSYILLIAMFIVCNDLLLHQTSSLLKWRPVNISHFMLEFSILCIRRSIIVGLHLPERNWNEVVRAL